ncbi:hypothetical protein [Deinococcus fonticola]|uniref:hypothetical protein n=1 Tax=Deinococcus fonticola TaxID=2528713 RepID=UPI0010757EF4|nr:hypothetical protein [Deinococcus fonticola]
MPDHESLQACMDFAVARYDRLHREDPAQAPAEVWTGVQDRLARYFGEKSIAADDHAEYLAAAQRAVYHHTGHLFEESGR